MKHQKHLALTKSICRKHNRLRATIIRRMTRAIKQNEKTFGVPKEAVLSLPFHVVLDSATEIHLRHVEGLCRSNGRLVAIVFDNYNESRRTLPVTELPTETLLAILEII